MSDRRSKRTSSVVPFIDGLEKDRNKNFICLIEKSKQLKMDGFEKNVWEDPSWVVIKGRLIKNTGKNTAKTTFNFNYSPSLGGDVISGDWADLAKALMSLRFHRKHQASSNQRIFITAIGYIAYCANKKNLSLVRLMPEVLDDACQLLSTHYSDSASYNLHKAIGEFAGHCDVNGLCRTEFKYKYTGMKRPDNTGGVEHKRLDDPETLNTKHDKLIAPEVFRVIGALYLNLPKDHKYRFYVLILSLLACLGTAVVKQVVA